MNSGCLTCTSASLHHGRNDGYSSTSLTSSYICAAEYGTRALRLTLRILIQRVHYDDSDSLLGKTYKTAFISTNRIPTGAMKRASNRQALNKKPELRSSSAVELRHMTQPANITISKPPNGNMILLVR